MPISITPLTAGALASHNSMLCVCRPCTSSQGLKKMMRTRSVVAQNGSVVSTSPLGMSPSQYLFEWQDTPINSHASSSTVAVVNVDTSRRSSSRKVDLIVGARDYREGSRSPSLRTATPRSAPIPIPPPASTSTRKPRDSLHPDDAYEVARSLHNPRNSLDVYRTRLERRMSRLNVTSPPKPMSPPLAAKRVRFDLARGIRYPGY